MLILKASFLNTSAYYSRYRYKYQLLNCKKQNNFFSYVTKYFMPKNV